MKKIQAYFYFCIFLLFQSVSLHAVTHVYSLRVRRLFNIPKIVQQKKVRWPFSVVPIYFSRSRDVKDVRTELSAREKRRSGGAVLNARIVPNKYWWAELTSAVQTDHATFRGQDNFHASRTGLDDIVLTGGYRHFIDKRGQIVGYGLVGLPTRRKIDLCDRHGPLVGTRLFSIGAGLEGSYSFINTLKQSLSLIAQTRFIHGFKRSWDPIVPKGGKIKPGNSTDIFLIMQYREKRTVFELGYDATIFFNQAIILPTQTLKTDTFTRHSGYLGISHLKPKGFFGKPFVFGAGLSVSNTKLVDARTTSAWIHGTIVF